MFFIFLRRRVIWIIALLGSALLAQSTNGSTFHFNEAMPQTVSCAGGTYQIAVTASYRFSGTYVGNSYYLDSIKVSNIPSQCSGKVFSIKGFGADRTNPLFLSGDCFFSATEGISAGQRVDVYYSGTKTRLLSEPISLSGHPPKNTYSWRFAGSQAAPQQGVAAQLLDSFAYPTAVDAHSFTIHWISGSDPATFCNGTNYTNHYISVPVASTLEKIDVAVQELQSSTRAELLKDGII